MCDFKFPELFNSFLKKKKWNLFNYQNDFLKSTMNTSFQQFLISSDIGTGKTLTLFLPLILDNLNKKNSKLIYVSPLKSIINDLYENLETLISELNLNLKISRRTSDESSKIKKRQIKNPGEILLTTPESLALLISKSDADNYLKSIKYLVIDELSEIINTKRGDQLSLTISQILNLKKNIKIFSCSANIQNFDYLTNWLSFNGKTKVIKNNFSKRLQIKIIYLDNTPDYGHTIDHALDKIYKIIKNKKTIIFVNTRAQSEILFKNLFFKYPDLKIGIFHSSLSKSLRFKAEKDIKQGKIDSIITTSALEMGIDWKNIDRILNIGTPKSVNKLIQRTGRSNHKYNLISEAILFPTNKFEYLECLALKNLILDRVFDNLTEKKGGKDVLCQHLLLLSCHSAFCPKKTFENVKKAYPYRNLKQITFNKILAFVHNGGYILKNYSNWEKLKKLEDGKYIVKNEAIKRDILMNSGTILDTSDFKIKTIKGRLLGTVEQRFVDTLKENDNFIFAGMTLVCSKIKENVIIVNTKKNRSKKVPVYLGGGLPLKSNLSDKILEILNNNYKIKFPSKIKDFINKQKQKSEIPNKERILIENFPYKNGLYIFIHTFLGKETNQTLSNLLINFFNSKDYKIVNYIVSDYSFGLFFNEKVKITKQMFNIFFKSKIKNLNSLDTAIAKRIFKDVAVISGLIKKVNIYSKKRNNNFVNSDTIFSAMKKYEPDHIILKITEEEIENHFIHSSQITKLSLLKYSYVRLTHCSEFSKALIMEKEQIKANELL